MKTKKENKIKKILLAYPRALAIDKSVKEPGQRKMMYYLYFILTLIIGSGWAISGVLDSSTNTNNIVFWISFGLFIIPIVITLILGLIFSRK